MLKKYKRDLIVITSLLAISLIMLLCIFLFSKSGDFVSVQVEGELVGIYSLSNDAEISIGDGTNILKIESGKAYMVYATCPDRVCVNTGKISRVGQSIICLPHKVTITVIGNSEGDVDLESR